jgi:hypothetical protein
LLSDHNNKTTAVLAYNKVAKKVHPVAPLPPESEDPSDANLPWPLGYE